MSNHFKHLSPHVCQKITGLFKKLSKRFQKLLAQVNETHSHNGSASLDHSDAKSEAESDVVSLYSPDLANDLSIYEEVLRMILEIINSCLAAKLNRNPNLVYTLLYSRDIFEPFQAHPSFSDIVMNIDTVLTYFSNRIDIESKENGLSVAEVYQIIQQASLQWPSDKLKVSSLERVVIIATRLVMCKHEPANAAMAFVLQKFPELKFRYVEDDSPEEFFIPYIWTLVYRSSMINFNGQNILLFNASRNVI